MVVTAGDGEEDSVFVVAVGEEGVPVAAGMERASRGHCGWRGHGLGDRRVMPWPPWMERTRLSPLGMGMALPWSSRLGMVWSSPRGDREGDVVAATDGEGVVVAAGDGDGVAVAPRIGRVRSLPRK